MEMERRLASLVVEVSFWSKLKLNSIGGSGRRGKAIYNLVNVLDVKDGRIIKRDNIGTNVL